MARELLEARLESKVCISEEAQCYHFKFTVDGTDQFSFAPGQFISAVATDPAGKQQTRAYSLASAPQGKSFELCVNRVREGFFSNYLADVENGDKILIHGPHGVFKLREPATDMILIATGTGIAPMRSILQRLFPADGSDRSQGKDVWLLYGTRHASELYFREEFESLAAKHANFHYLPTLSRPEEDWTGPRGYVQDHLARIVEERAERLGLPLIQPPVDASIPAAERKFGIYSYICGLNNMVAGVRETLAGFGWDRAQIVYERYD